MNFKEGDLVVVTKRSWIHRDGKEHHYVMDGVFKGMKTDKRALVEVNTKAEGIKIVSVTLDQITKKEAA